MASAITEPRTPHGQALQAPAKTGRLAAMPYWSGADEADESAPAAVAAIAELWSARTEFAEGEADSIASNTPLNATTKSFCTIASEKLTIRKTAAGFDTRDRGFV